MFVDAPFGKGGKVLPEERRDLTEEVDERVEDLVAPGLGRTG